MFIQSRSYLINVNEITTVKNGPNGKAEISLTDGRKLRLTCNYNEVLVAINDSKNQNMVHIEYFDD